MKNVIKLNRNLYSKIKMFRLTKRYFSSDMFQNEIQKMIIQRKSENLDLRLSNIWAIGVIPCGLVGMSAGVWKGITENKYASLEHTFIQACALGFVGGAMGVVGWTTLPLTAPVFGLTYLHKKMNK